MQRTPARRREKSGTPTPTSWFAAAATAAGALVVATLGCAHAAQTSGSARTPSAQVAAGADTTTTASATLRDRSGATVGTARLTGDANGAVHLVVHVDQMTPGRHGIHFHAVGSCEPGDSTAFASAGGHHNPLGRKHGLENPDGAHAGDLPNIEVGANGSGDLDTTTSRATLRASPASLFDADGSAIVVHAAADDQKTDPSGNSGARVACAVISKS